MLTCLPASERPLNWGCGCTPDSMAASLVSHASLLPCKLAQLVPTDTKRLPIVQCPFGSAPGGWTQTPLITPSHHGMISESREGPREQLADGDAASAPGPMHFLPSDRTLIIAMTFVLSNDTWHGADLISWTTQSHSLRDRFVGSCRDCAEFPRLCRGAPPAGFRPPVPAPACRARTCCGSTASSHCPARPATRPRRPLQGRKCVVIPPPSSRRPFLQDTPSVLTQVLQNPCLPGQ